MSENAVYVEIIGRDMMSPVIDNLLGRMNGVGNVAENFWGALGAEVFVRGIDLAIDRVRALTSALGEAASIETQQIAAASDIATNLGISMERSRAIVNDTAKQIAVAASSLPGETQGFNEIFNAISGAVSDQIKDPEEFQRMSIELTKRIGALAAIRGQSTADAGSQAMRLLAGTVGYGEARASFDFLQKNPMLQRAIEQQAAALGTSVEDWKTMAADMRLQIFQKALSQAAPDQLFDSFKGTAEDYIQTLKTRFFDPSIGIFGMMREVSTRGNRTVLEAATGSLANFSGLLDSLGKLDWAFDPLAGLIDFLDGLSGFFHGLRRQIVGGGGGFDLSAISGDGILAMGDWFGQALIDAVHNFGAVFNSIDWEQVGAVAKSIILAIAYNISRVPHQLARMIEEVNWDKVGAALVEFAAWLADVIFSLVPIALNALVGGVRLLLVGLGAVVNVALAAIGHFLVELLKDLTIRPLMALFEMFVDPIESLKDFVGSAIDRVKSAFSSLFDRVRSIIDGIGNAARNVVSNIPFVGRMFNSSGESTAPDAADNKGWQLPNTTASNAPVTAQPVTTPTPANSGSTANTFAPQVNIPVSTGADANAIGEAVVNRLNAMYRQYNEGVLA